MIRLVLYGAQDIVEEVPVAPSTPDCKEIIKSQIHSRNREIDRKRKGEYINEYNKRVKT